MGELSRIRSVAVASVLLFILLTGTDGDKSYCDICRDHTLCIYQGFGQACNRVLATGTTKADQETIVDVHNRLRNRVASGSESRGRPGPQPPAADMNALVWDDELAKIAQRWADQCSFEHDSCRDVGRFKVGQNIYMSRTTGTVGNADWKAAIEAWYEEVKDFNKNNVNSYQFSAETGHYSQVAWGATRHVGCGRTAHVGPGRWKTDLYVCNYGPAGNFLRNPVYKIGQGCSKCDSGCHNTYTSLCA